MRIRFILLLIFFLFYRNSFAADFLDGFEDIPLMSGFKQISTQDFSFGNEEAGYIEAIITTQKNFHFKDVKTFYCDSLSALGWEIKSNDSKSIFFSRDSDILEISQMQKSPIMVVISLKSRN